MAKEMTADEREALCAWVQQLRTRFDGEPPDVPVEDLLALAGAVATGVARPAVPVTAYVAGYLAALRTRDPGARSAAQVVQDVVAAVPATGPGDG